MFKFFNLAASGLLQIVFSLVVFADSSSVTIPLQAVSIDLQQNNKVGITVSIAGGPPSLLTFDTGGSGLHIMQSQVPNVQPGPDSQYASIGFGSGVVYTGYIATLPITIDQPDGTAAATTKPMPVMIVQKVSCADGSNNCNLPAPGQPQYGYFWGEFGAGMNPEVLQVQNAPETNAILCSPIRYLPGNLSTGFSIENLTPSSDVEGSQGQLVIGLPSSGIPSQYARIALPEEKEYACPGLTGPIYNDRNIQLTYQIGSYPSEKLTSVFDTGGGSNINYVTGNKEGYPIQGGGTLGLLEAGLPFSVSIGSFQWKFTSGTENNLNEVDIMDPTITSGTAGYFVNLGIVFFFYYNAIFDYTNGHLAFAPNPYGQIEQTP